MQRDASRRLKQLLRDERAAIVPLFALVLFILLGCSALAIDTIRGYRVYTQIAQALDAAALTTAKVLRLQASGDAELQEIARESFRANVRDIATGEASYSSVALSIDRAAGRATLDIVALLPTTLGRLLGLDHFRIPATSTAIYAVNDIELALVLNVNDSMGGRRIGALIEAGKDLVDRLLVNQEAGAGNRIALAPYGTAVNAGVFAERVTGSWRRDACVTERPGSLAFSDERPERGPLGRRSTVCPRNEIVPLTAESARLNTALDVLGAEGDRAGHLGLAWAWYLLSPNWGDVWPQASKPRSYGDQRLRKAIVLITDGEFDRSFEPGNGDARTQVERLCDNIKLADVMVFTIGFEAPAAVHPLLQYCASSPGHFIDAKSDDDVRTALMWIARQLTAIRFAQ